jgi:hypothetical protein
MRFYKIDIKGKVWLERIGIPSYTADDKGRIIYETSLDQLHFGCAKGGAANFIPVFDGVHSMLPVADITYNIGHPSYRWNSIYAADFYGQVRYA